MDNKDIQTNSPELNDEELANVSGGRLKPLSLSDPPPKLIDATCVNCQTSIWLLEDVYLSRLINGAFYCDNCKNAMT